MFRNLWFQLHWIIGISFGIVLAVVGVTGGVLSFEQPIIKAASRGIMTVEAPAGASRLAPEALLAAIHRQAPDRTINSLAFSPAPGDAVGANFASGRARGTTVYADPYTGALLGEARGRGFMQTMRGLHRWLLLDISVGRPIVGIATALLLVLGLSGLYLRWPKRIGNWRTWLTFSFRQKGRSFLWHMHAVFGTWCLLLYLLAALTGLWWSFGWYRAGVYQVAGVEQPQRRGPPRAAAPGTRVDPTAIRMNDVWQTFTDTVGAAGYRQARFTLPSQATGNVNISYLPATAAHERASDQMVINAGSGKLVSRHRYTDRRTGEKFIASIFPLHSGSFFGTPGVIAMMLASLAMPVFAITGWLLYLDRRRKKKARRADMQGVHSTGLDRPEAVLVTYASQSGNAERYAWLSAGRLQAAGVPVTVRALGSLHPGELAGFRHALFSLASFGDGEAPDNARSFARRMRSEQPHLPNLRFGLLAFGDTTYEHFCGFGRSVAAWLQARGARPLFDSVHVDLEDTAAIDTWKQRLGAFAGGDGSWDETPFATWRLRQRQCINPGSMGSAISRLELVPATGQVPAWQAGDLVEIRIGPPGTPGVTREYSIASIPADGAIHLLVREARHPDGRLGAGSAFLLQALDSGAELSLRLRNNSGFHAPADAAPMILIGNGTGIAGLHSHLREREARDHHRNWLVFGERQRERDFLYREDIQRWHAQGHLERLDLAFSRDQADRVYVQDRLREHAASLRAWIADGACVYVCGSLAGMAPGVEAALTEVLGPAGFDALLTSGRYRRDVY